MSEQVLAQYAELYSLVQEIYSNHGAGGYLHVALDDGNLEDADILSCRAALEMACPDKVCTLCDMTWVQEWYQNPAYTPAMALADCYQAQLTCIDMLGRMTQDEREAFYEAYWKAWHTRSGGRQDE